MATLAELEAELEQLQAERTSARLRASQAPDGSRLEFIPDKEYASKIEALEMRIAARRNRPVGPVYQTTRSFKDL